MKNPSPSDQNPSPVVSKFARAYGCLPWLVAVFAVFVLAGMVLPVFNSVAVRGCQTKALANAKQVGLALKLFAGDNDGYYPRQGTPEQNKILPANANVAFACLFPTYTQSEFIFGNRLSGYSTRTPDDVIDPVYNGKPVKTLEPGENVYGYIMGLRDDGSPNTPLIVDGTDGSRHYNRVEGIRGGLWKGERAIVIRLDNSGRLERLEGRDNTRYLPRQDDRFKNLLDVGYLGKDARYLDPAVAGP